MGTSLMGLVLLTIQDSDDGENVEVSITMEPPLSSETRVFSPAEKAGSLAFHHLMTEVLGPGGESESTD